LLLLLNTDLTTAYNDKLHEVTATGITRTWIIKDKYLNMLFQSMSLTASLNAFSCITEIIVALSDEVTISNPLSRFPALNFSLVWIPIYNYSY
ncbi:MAG: hypothetical protein ACK56I_32765, partial [bacterium]